MLLWDNILHTWKRLAFLDIVLISAIVVDIVTNAPLEISVFLYALVLIYILLRRVGCTKVQSHKRGTIWRPHLAMLQQTLTIGSYPYAISWRNAAMFLLRALSTTQRFYFTNRWHFKCPDNEHAYFEECNDFN